MSTIISKIKNGLYTGEEMWISILLAAAIIIGLGWCLVIAWQRNYYLRERLKGIVKYKSQIKSICRIALAGLVIYAMFTTYLAYMTLIDAIAIFAAFGFAVALLEKKFSGEWSFAPAKSSTVIYAIVAVAIMVYIKLNGPFFSTPSLVIFALVLSDGIGEIYRLVKGKKQESK